MGWRFRKRIKIFPGFYINFSKSGIGINVGVPGANVTFGPNGTSVNTGIPGTGLYRRDKVSTISHNEKSNNDSFIASKEYVRDKLSKNILGDLVAENSEEIIKSEQSREEVRDCLGKLIKNGNKESSCAIEDLKTPINPKGKLLGYKYPILDLLNCDNDSVIENNMRELEQNKDTIIRLLANFGIQISHISATPGARITLYEIMLAPGMKASQIKGLEDDIALAICSHNVKFLIPVPGKGTIGILVPNEKSSVISIRDVFNIRFMEIDYALPCVIGKKITNETCMFDLSKSPNVLIGGSTGQGKSSVIHSIITSLLFKKHPSELKLVLMEPYGLEFTKYNKLSSHFLASVSETAPIITDSKCAVSTLSQLCELMDTRYAIIKNTFSENIKDYNIKYVNHKFRKFEGFDYMPYIVVVIDEISKFYEEGLSKFESSLFLLAQYGRKVGIHLIISTNRPTCDILNSKIKVNFPTRISFRVPETIDSMVILDCDGAENLYGAGDMLYRQGVSSSCERVQGSYISPNEIERVCNYIYMQPGFGGTYEISSRNQYEGNKGESSSEVLDTYDLDPLFEEVAHAIVVSQQGSQSMIQRRFSIGYHRAERLMDQLEQAGVVGTAQGSMPRKVLITDPISLDYLIEQLKG